MHLSKTDLAKIRPLQWRVTTVGDRLYHTAATTLDTQLFWIDFLRNVFAPLYAQQTAISQIATFDQQQPVLIDSQRNLIVPQALEEVAYYARNKTAPVQFIATRYSQRTVLLIVVFFLVLVAFFNMLVGSDVPSRLERLV